MPPRDRADAAVVLLSLATATCAVAGYAAMAAGGGSTAGTGSAGERNLLVGSFIVGLFAAVVLVLTTVDQSPRLGPTTTALVGLVVAALLMVPAAWAFAAPVSTAQADSAGCGSISTPSGALTGAPPYGDAVAVSCRDRLDKQKIIFAALCLPALGSVTLSLVPLAPRRGRNTEAPV